MKGISLWQPWASLWCSRRKVHETRHWRCRHRGWLLVHAAKRFEKDFDLGEPLPQTGRLALAALLEKARTRSWRLWARDAPFEMKDALKARGYTWNPGDC